MKIFVSNKSSTQLFLPSPLNIALTPGQVVHISIKPEVWAEMQRSSIFNRLQRHNIISMGAQLDFSRAANEPDRAPTQEAPADQALPEEAAAEADMEASAPELEPEAEAEAEAEAEPEAEADSAQSGPKKRRGRKKKAGQ